MRDYIYSVMSSVIGYAHTQNDPLIGQQVVHLKNKMAQIIVILSGPWFL